MVSIQEHLYGILCFHYPWIISIPHLYPIIDKQNSKLKWCTREDKTRNPCSSLRKMKENSSNQHKMKVWLVVYDMYKFSE